MNSSYYYLKSYLYPLAFLEDKTMDKKIKIEKIFEFCNNNLNNEMYVVTEIKRYLVFIINFINDIFGDCVISTPVSTESILVKLASAHKKLSSKK